MQMLVMEGIENVDDGVKVWWWGSLMKAIRFADDQAIAASTNFGLPELMYEQEKKPESLKIGYEDKKKGNRGDEVE